jgi:hypothetical protein
MQATKKNERRRGNCKQMVSVTGNKTDDRDEQNKNNEKDEDNLRIKGARNDDENREGQVFLSYTVTRYSGLSVYHETMMLFLSHWMTTFSTALVRSLLK